MKKFCRSLLAIALIYFGSIMISGISPLHVLGGMQCPALANPEDDDDDMDEPVLPPITNRPMPQDSIMYHLPLHVITSN
ncbi:MAG: hypothetical protein HC819_19925 [Cyclobacteriaceae bacterium]|nr:hypothetical protein [Cyclobacteriaceae bacterium]